jgi:predicted acetyltransferase
MPELIAPTRHLRTSWLEANSEWGPGVHEDGFGLLGTDEVDSLAGFEALLARLADEQGRCTYRWVTDGNHVLGGIALRHESHELVARAGHIGFGIRPSARRRGLAAWALGRMLGEAKVLGMDRVLVMCEAGNIASAKTIQSQGGTPAELGNAADDAAWRYWIQL